MSSVPVVVYRMAPVIVSAADHMANERRIASLYDGRCAASLDRLARVQPLPMQAFVMNAGLADARAPARTSTVPCVGSAFVMQSGSTSATVSNIEGDNINRVTLRSSVRPLPLEAFQQEGLQEVSDPTCARTDGAWNLQAAPYPSPCPSWEVDASNVHSIIGESSTNAC